MHSLHAGNVSCQSRSLQATHVLTVIVHWLTPFQPTLYGLYVLLQALWNINISLAQLQARHVKTGVKL